MNNDHYALKEDESDWRTRQNPLIEMLRNSAVRAESEGWLTEDEVDRLLLSDQHRDC